MSNLKYIASHKPMLFKTEDELTAWIARTFLYQAIPRWDPSTAPPGCYEPDEKAKYFRTLRTWCEDHIGPMIRFDHKGGRDAKGVWFDNITLDETCRWSAGHSFFQFRHLEDAIMFRVMFSVDLIDRSRVVAASN